MKNSKAIVTLAIGETYLKRWESLCRDNWQQYANRHGYDVICIDTPLDNSSRAEQRSPAWQKCLILSEKLVQHYERVVWIDSDILINAATAPCIVKDVPFDKVGAVEVWSSPTPQLFTQTLEREFEFWGTNGIVNQTAQDFYANYGLPPEFDKVVQTGVMVLTPQWHRQVLEKAYYDYEDKGSSGWNYEMRPLSYELLKADCIHWVDHRFNLCWIDYQILHYPFLLNQNYQSSTKITRLKQKLITLLLGYSYRSRYKEICATTAFINSFFLHFAGVGSDMSLVDTKVTSWQELISP
jgi:hypothetical protein